MKKIFIFALLLSAIVLFGCQGGGSGSGGCYIEGEYLNGSGSCCSGLTEVQGYSLVINESCFVENESVLCVRECYTVDNSTLCQDDLICKPSEYNVCINLTNGECGVGENWCNAPSDCNRSQTNVSSY